MAGARRKIVTIAGARPQFIKAFALSRALKDDPDFEEVLVHTGQHFDDRMSAVFFEELEMPPPRHSFSIHGSSHGAMTGDMLKAIEGVLQKERPAAVIVYGDTNSTLAGALAAAKLGVFLIHIEAGLRSFNRSMPEEINRIVADHVSDALFCPTEAAVENLAREGITRNVFKTGDLMYDAALAATPIAERRSRILETLGLSPRDYGVATIHRAANTDDPRKLSELVDYLAAQARELPIVFPVHPRTRAAAQKAGVELARPGLRLVEPLGYLDMCRLLRHAAVVMTDSGGVQKEAYFHRAPCVTLRDETEWTETIDFGWNRLWRTADYRPRRDIPDFGDGDAAKEILSIIRSLLLS
ncbi:MAG TPA: UDP-N-acetylglucosamine 2-epimerase (non-hydrolyzing) [Rhizomicrobium sp.]|jgi:UDP-GlcNAc3NAcA epimerase|nr:UDP-N-acetylglucosamine 2-epimerase (non-hydrolyzing) [Rhizomicrobium sp.]